MNGLSNNSFLIVGKNGFAELAHGSLFSGVGVFQSWTHRVGSIGNAVNPTVAYYLFECIKYHFLKRMEKKLLLRIYSK